jgi:hypothetical protein
MDFENNIYLFNEVMRLDADVFNYVLLESKNFAHKLSIRKEQSISYYTNNRRAVRPKENTILGKMAEMFSINFMTSVFSYPLIFPDFTIYNPGEKNWSEDLRYSNIDRSLKDFHVKSCDSITRKYLNYEDISWTFQKSNESGHGGKDFIYKGINKDIVLFVYLESYEKNEALISFSAPFIKIKPLLRPPKSKGLVGIKECVYLNDVLSNNC